MFNYIKIIDWLTGKSYLITDINDEYVLKESLKKKLMELMGNKYPDV